MTTGDCLGIGIIGGTGKEGSGLAVRWARAGHAVRIGSRDASRGAQRARELTEVAGREIEGGSNEAALEGADVAVLSVPYSAHGATLRTCAPALQGKLLIDITVPLAPPKVRRVHLPEGRAAALEAQALLGPGTPVIAALHHVSSVHLADPDHVIDCDVLVCGDDTAARDTAVRLIEDLGVRALHAGPLENAIALEALTPVLLFLNSKYRSSGTGIRFTGLP